MLLVHLVSLFTTAILVWALFAYADLWVYHNLKITQRALARLLCSEERRSHDLYDYIIVQGTYKGRTVVCRLSHFSASQLLRYNLRLHIHMEPFTVGARYQPRTYLTEHTRLDNNYNIYYETTSATSMKSYLFAAIVPEYEFISIFEELTHAAEIVEASR